MKWEFITEISEEKQKMIAKELNISTFFAGLLTQIISEETERKDFLMPKLHPPFEMKGMQEAVSLLDEVLSQNKRILFYGDYDVDGISSVAMAYLFFSQFHDNIDCYIPSRLKEGYGLSDKGVAYALETNCDLVITMDCGSSCNKNIQKLKDNRIRCIICDHHAIGKGQELPKADVILNPKQGGCSYPFKELSGCGVVFKFLEAFCLYKKWDISLIHKWIDFVTISTCCDIVALRGENRAFVKKGLKYMKKSPNMATQTLMKLFSTPDINEENIGFTIGPLINVAGRLTHPKEALAFFIEKDAEKSQELLDELKRKNEKRKEIQKKIFQEAKELLKKEKNKSANFLFKADWHEGISGIIASKCVEHNHLPTIILTETEQGVVGSARSPAGFDMYEAVKGCGDMLIRFGGHKYAAGMTLERGNLEKFKEKFLSIAGENIKKEVTQSILYINKIVNLTQIGDAMMGDLEELSPFGSTCKRPIFVAENVSWAYPPQLLSTQHIKGTIKQGNSFFFDVIGFFMPEIFKEIEKETHFHICFQLGYNTFRGEKKIQLKIKDIKTPNQYP